MNVACLLKRQETHPQCYTLLFSTLDNKKMLTTTGSDLMDKLYVLVPYVNKNLKYEKVGRLNSLNNMYTLNRVFIVQSCYVICIAEIVKYNVYLCCVHFVKRLIYSSIKPK